MKYITNERKKMKEWKFEINKNERENMKERILEIHKEWNKDWMYKRMNEINKKMKFEKNENETIRSHNFIDFQSVS